MTKPCVFLLGLGIGAWTVPLAQRLADNYSGRHWLSINN